MNDRFRPKADAHHNIAMKLPKLPIPLIVAGGFCAVVGIVLLGAYLLRDVPTPEEACQRQCAVTHRSGQMVPIYPPAQTAGMRGRGPTECQCQ